jgi:predicted DNA-binding protein (UPF0251 family)
MVMTEELVSENDQIVELYRQLKNGNKVAEQLGISNNTVYKVLKDLGIATDRFHKHLTIFQENNLIDLINEYNTGAKPTELAKKYNCAHITVLETLRKAGVEIRGAKTRLNESELEEIRLAYESGLNMKEVARKVGRHVNTIIRIINTNFSEISRSGKSGPGGPHWGGGRNRDGHGYIWVWVSPDDPMASMAVGNGRGRSSYVLEHRLAMARKIGRPLRDTETVHHIDGDRTNNAQANLELRQGKHGKHVVMMCLDCGSHNVGHAPLSN